jgi:hypothetical protein
MDTGNVASTMSEAIEILLNAGVWYFLSHVAIRRPVQLRA